MLSVQIDPSPWNSLELIKLMAGLLAPLTVLAFGFWINRRLKQVEHLQWASQKVVEKRLQVFDQFAPQLNDLFCYFTFVGGWKDVDPISAVRMKRTLDRIAYVHAPLFPPDFLKYYNNLMEKCYATFSGWGRDCQLRTAIEPRRKSREDWDEKWDACFTPAEQQVEPKEVQQAYGQFMRFFAESLGINLQVGNAPVGRAPNIHD